MARPTCRPRCGSVSGKTTGLSPLLFRARIVGVEGAEELSPAHVHVVRLMAHRANVEGAGHVGLRDLVRRALRMRPDRLVG